MRSLLTFVLYRFQKMVTIEKTWKATYILSKNNHPIQREYWKARTNLYWATSSKDQERADEAI